MRAIRRQSGGVTFPIPNPKGPLSRALALFVLTDPGATATSGANETGILDPFLNKDPSAKRTQRLLHDAGIDPNVCVWWNASPYHVGGAGGFTEALFERGADWLGSFIECCPHLGVVVAMGDPANEVARRVWRDAGRYSLPPLVTTCHPMMRGRGYWEKAAQREEALKTAARLIRRPTRHRPTAGLAGCSAAAGRLVRKSQADRPTVREQPPRVRERRAVSSAMSAYPINSSELARRLLGRELIPGDDYGFLQGEVRALLQRFGCPRESDSYRPRYVVYHEMAERVAEALGRQLP
jgi:hypothetical protein